MNNSSTTWEQGRFIDQHRFSNWSQEQKDKADNYERLLVRPSPTGNAICQCTTPEEAEWIVSRLNLAAKLEQVCGDWISISDQMPPSGVWLEFYDGNKTMGHEPFNHIDILNKRKEAQVGYLYNYTHWRRLTSPANIVEEGL